MRIIPKVEDKKDLTLAEKLVEHAKEVLSQTGRKVIISEKVKTIKNILFKEGKIE